jgi:hypothetical protein
LALNDEQRAMLQLLLEGGQGYEDIGSLLGTPPDEVRSRARDALREMGGADPDAQVGLSDYLLGQADPIGRADAVRHLQSDPDANALAQRLVTQLRLIAPKAELPEIPPAKGGRRAAAPPPPAKEPTEQVPSTPPPGPAPGAPAGPGFATRVAGVFGGGGNRAKLAIAGVGALALLLVVVIIVAGSGGDDDGGGGDGDCNTVDTSQAEEAGVPRIALTAVGAAAESDCPPNGQMTLSPVQAQGQNQQSAGFAFQVEAADLEPTSDGEVYVLWLYNSDEEAFPLGQQTVDANGNLQGGVPLAPQEVLLLAAFQTVRLSRASSSEAQGIQQELQSRQGRQAGQPVPFVGDPALEGDVAELGLEQLLQEAQAQAGGGQGQQGQGQGGQGAQGGASQ